MDSFAAQRGAVATAAISTIVAVAIVVAAALSRPQLPSRPFRVALSSETLSEIGILDRRYRDCYSAWRPEQGIRSPCPQVQNEINLRMIELLGLRNGSPRDVTRVLGEPEVVFENKRYAGILYGRFPFHWVTMAPNCVMLLPRNGNYDAMMQMSIEQDGSHLAKWPSDSSK